MTVKSVLRQPLAGLGLRLLAPAALAASAAALLLSACGGGTSQAVAFQPSRLVVFGDEASVLDDSDGLHNARKYSVNGFDTTKVARSCEQLPTMPQYVAARYGLVFEECNSAAATATAFSKARAGAKVDDGAATSLVKQIDGVTLSSGDLVSVWIGTNDIIEIYRNLASGRLTQAAAQAEVERRGTLLAEQVNRILTTGARALVFTVPDLGLSPYARARLTSADPDDATVPADAAATSRLTQLSLDFNGYLRTRIDQRRFDGRNFGLLFADEAVQQVVLVPSGFTAYLASPYNVTEAACLVALPDCNDAASTVNPGQLVTGANNSTHLWASDRWLGFPGHHLLGAQAQSRLASLPF